MKILAFETSCDDTSIAVFDNNSLVSMETASQIKIHNITGGVVPEVAAREHANSIFEVLKTALEKAFVNLEDIDYIGVTTNPGLLPSLLTGVTVAGTISTVLNIPIIPINHIRAHIFANYLERDEEEIQYPLVCLTVSGGHNEIYYMKSMWDLERLGGTTDDAAGEAFDKVAKMMGLGYPGGPIISKLAAEYEKTHRPPPNPRLTKVGGKSGMSREGLFPRVWLIKKGFDFSFSGLKSSVKREVDKRGELSDDDVGEIASEFENSVVEVLAYKLINAAKLKGATTVMLAGGVSANDKLNELISKMAKKEGLTFISPTKKLYSTDNAAMVGIKTYHKVKDKKFEHHVGSLKI